MLQNSIGHTIGFRSSKNLPPKQHFGPCPQKQTCGQAKQLSQPPPSASEVDKRAPKKYEVYGVKRGETGICNVKDLKTLGKKAPIRWYVSPAYLKNMKRFQFIIEENPHASQYYSDEWDEWDDGWW